MPRTALVTYAHLELALLEHKHEYLIRFRCSNVFVENKYQPLLLTTTYRILLSYDHRIVLTFACLIFCMICSIA